MVKSMGIMLKRFHPQALSARERGLEVSPRLKFNFKQNRFAPLNPSRFTDGQKHVYHAETQSSLDAICAQTRTQSLTSTESSLWAKSIAPLNLSRFTDGQEHAYHADSAFADHFSSAWYVQEKSENVTSANIVSAYRFLGFHWA